MANTKRDIKYLNRDFSEFRSRLIEYSKTYFPQIYNDFSATSPGMMFMEQASYVGDVLSYYLDNQFQETFVQYAQQTNNVYELAYMFGYKPKTTGVSQATITLFQQLPAISVGGEFKPDYNYALEVKSNTTIASSEGVKFLIQDKCDFSVSSSLDPTKISIYQTSGGNPQYFLLEKTRKAISATISTTTFDFSDPQSFSTVNIQDENIIKILDITDSDGNLYYEVDHLGQETVLTSIKNTNINNPNNVGLGLPFMQDKLTAAYSPTNFLFTDTYGTAPANTTLTVRYLTGGGVNSNIGSDALNVLDKTNVKFLNTNLNSTTANYTFNSLTGTNQDATSGGKGGDTLEEIRQNTLSLIASQKRSVTADDYLVRSLSMPSDFGSIAKAIIEQPKLTDNQISTLNTLCLYVLSFNRDRKLTTPSETLKNNLRTYLSQHRMIGDSIEIKDAYIINIGIDFEIVTLPEFNTSEVLLSCINSLKNHFNIDNYQINQPIMLKDLFIMLDKIEGVQTVKEIKLKNLAGPSLGYSQYSYDIESATSNHVIYPSLDPSIFEIRYPDSDIKGRVVSL